MTLIKLPEFSNTPADQIPDIVSRVRKTFHSQKTRPAEFRLKQLRKLYWTIVDHEKELMEACQRDLGKGFFEALATEINWVQNDIIFMTKNLEKWMKDEKPADIPLSNWFMSPRIRKDPLGIVLVIGYGCCCTHHMPLLTMYQVHSTFQSSSRWVPSLVPSRQETLWC